MYTVATEDGRVIGSIRNGCTNYYLSGLEKAVWRLETGVVRLLERLKIDRAEVRHIHMALAGADTDQDVRRIEEALHSTVIGQIPHTLESDVWVAFSAQTTEKCGAISICGTGHNTGVLLKSGEKICIQANRYPLGNFGGGRMICDMALNAAYLSREYTGEKSSLEDRIAEMCDCSSLDDLAEKVIRSKYTYQYRFPVAKLVKELAAEGDEVSRGILRETGFRQGHMTGRLIARAGLEGESIPVVLAGSVYCQAPNHDLLDAYREELGRFCPDARMQVLDREPVEGAILSAIRRLKGDMDQRELEAISAVIRVSCTEMEEKSDV